MLRHFHEAGDARAVQRLAVSGLLTKRGESRMAIRYPWLAHRVLLPAPQATRVTQVSLSAGEHYGSTSEGLDRHHVRHRIHHRRRHGPQIHHRRPQSYAPVEAGPRSRL